MLIAVEKKLIILMSPLYYALSAWQYFPDIKAKFMTILKKSFNTLKFEKHNSNALHRHAYIFWTSVENQDLNMSLMHC